MLPGKEVQAIMIGRQKERRAGKAKSSTISSRDVLLALAFIAPAVVLVVVLMYYPMVRAFIESSV